MWRVEKATTTMEATSYTADQLQDIFSIGNEIRQIFAKKEEGGERNRGHIQNGSYTNTELKAEQGFDEHFTQRALYGSSVHARSVCVKVRRPMVTIHWFCSVLLARR